jgi:hypothetical protein
MMYDIWLYLRMGHTTYGYSAGKMMINQEIWRYPLALIHMANKLSTEFAWPTKISRLDTKYLIYLKISQIGQPYSNFTQTQHLCFVAHVQVSHAHQQEPSKWVKSCYSKKRYLAVESPLLCMEGMWLLDKNSFRCAKKNPPFRE